jgi:competence ComEA-like helix-hairpin-helix protein
MPVTERDYMRDREPRPIIRRPSTLVPIALGVLIAIIVVAVASTRSTSPTRTRDSVEIERPVTDAVRIVNVNTASLEELDALPHVTPRTAQAIIDGRPYRAVDDLIRVTGIGDRTLERIRPFVHCQ